MAWRGRGAVNSHLRRKLFIAVLLVGVMQFAPGSSADVPPLVLVDSTCQQLASNIAADVPTPMTSTSENLVSTCTVNGTKLDCVLRGQDPSTTFGGRKNTRETYEIVGDDKLVLAAVKHGTLGSEQLLVFKETHRFVSTGTYFQALPKVIQKQCVGQMR